jgi:hypothetical protein
MSTVWYTGSHTAPMPAALMPVLFVPRAGVNEAFRLPRDCSDPMTLLALKMFH